MNLLYLDFETYYDVQLSLTKMTTVQYVNHPDFKIWGVGLKFNEGDTEWFGEDQYQDALEQIPWEETAVVCHNTLFDAYILTQYSGLLPSVLLRHRLPKSGRVPKSICTTKRCSCPLFSKR